MPVTQEPGSPQTASSGSPWSWMGLREKAWQALSLSAVLSAIAGVAFGAGYFAIIRGALTLGIPNPEASKVAYQYTGATMLLDTLAILGSGIPSFGLTAIAALLVVSGSVAICLRATSAAAKCWGIIVGYAVLVAMAVRDSLQVYSGFSTSNLLLNDPAPLATAASVPHIVEAVARGDASFVTPGYGAFAAAILTVLVASAILAGLARDPEFRVSWRGRVVTAQLVVAVSIVGEIILLSQLYGVVRLAKSPRCVQADYSQAGAAQLQSKEGWLMSDLAFGGDTVYLLEPQANPSLHVLKRADIFRYQLLQRTECRKSLVPNVLAVLNSRTPANQAELYK